MLGFSGATFYSFQAYYYLTSQLVELQQRLQSMEAFGTDSEDELIKACKSVLKESMSLRCFHHLQQNVERTMKNLIGIQEYENGTRGLLEAGSEEEFDQAFQDHIKSGKSYQTEISSASTSVTDQ